MPHPVAGFPETRQERRTIGLVALLVVSAPLLGWLGGEAQSCVLYGDPARQPPVGLFDVRGPLARSMACLQAHGWSGDVLTSILPLLVDDLFAIGYGGGVGLLIWRWGAAAARHGWRPWSVALLRLAALSYPLAGVFDLIENQLVIAALLIGDSPGIDVVLLVARAAAIPKYGLTFIAAPLLLIVAAVPGLILKSRQA